MTESAFTRKLLKDLRARLVPRGAVLYKHNDFYTAGVPDFTITIGGRTTWWEIKVAPNTPTKLQQHFLDRLAPVAFIITYLPKTQQIFIRWGEIEAAYTYKEALDMILIFATHKEGTMSNTWATQVAEFNMVNGYPAPVGIKHPLAEVQVLRLRLMMEELGELSCAMHEKDLIEVADGLIDLLYVVVGTAVEYGLGPILDQLFAEVHRSNMTKFKGELTQHDVSQVTAIENIEGLVNDKYSGKVRKGGHFEPPRIAWLIDNYLDALKRINEA
jgi:hypothetical protein